MKKIVLFIAVFLITFASIGIFALRKNEKATEAKANTASIAQEEEKTVVAVVEGIEIYKETIDFLATADKILLKNSIQSGSEPSVADSADADAILKEQIRDAVVLAEAKRQGLAASVEEAEEYTLGNYEVVKEVGGETYQILRKYMVEMNLTEEEYLEICTTVNRNKLTRAKLYDEFSKDKIGSDNEIATEYEKYVAGLIEKADIEYK